MKSKLKFDPEDYRVKVGTRVDLSRIDSDDDGGLDKDAAESEFARLREKLEDLQGLLYAECKHSLLVVLQAMDGGEEGRHHPLGLHRAQSPGRAGLQLQGPHACRAIPRFSLARASERAAAGVHQRLQSLPLRGRAFIVRVKELVPRKKVDQRYGQTSTISRRCSTTNPRAWSSCSCTFSKGYQKQRLERRLTHQDKEWKFNPTDLRERKRWGEYQRAYEVALSRCSTAHALRGTSSRPSITGIATCWWRGFWWINCNR